MLFLATSCEAIDRKMELQASYDLVVPNIEKSINANVCKKYSFRKNHPPSYLIVDTKDTLYMPRMNLIEQLKVGDSLSKKANDNIIFVYRNNKLVFRTWYMFIPEYLRQSEMFPVKWKEKWMESTFDPRDEKLNLDSLRKVHKL